MFRRTLRSVAALAIVLAIFSSPAHSQYTGPTPYLSSSDSPFNFFSFSYFHLQDFEPGTVAPGYAATTGGRILGPDPLTDSVDVGGSSWFSDEGGGVATSLFTFTFDAGVLGRLPTHVGIVWTDVGTPLPGGPVEFPGVEPGRGFVTFLAFDSAGDQIGAGIIRAGPLGDGAVDGNKAEDRFFGVVHPAGVAAIEVYMIASADWEVDHLQYGALAAIPEPEQWLLMALGVAAVALRIKRRRRIA